MPIFYKIITLFFGKEKNSISTSTGIQTKKEILKKFFIILPIIALIDILAQLCLYVYCFIDPNGQIIGFRNTDINLKIIHEEDLFFIVGIDIFFRYFSFNFFKK